MSPSGRPKGEYRRAQPEACSDSRGATAEVVFLLDVDNTLLDNDRIIADLHSHLEAAFGVASAARYWAAFEALRAELGYADYLGALQLYRANTERDGCNDEQLLLVSSFLIDYPFSERLYPRALEVVSHLGRVGLTVILSDGDVVFQPRKVQRSGLWDAVGGRVLIYVHKEKMLDEVQRRHPAHHYVMVDDKLRLLTAMKGILGSRLTTVFPRQGHYAIDLTNAERYPAPDVTVEHIGDLVELDAVTLAAPALIASKPGAQSKRDAALHVDDGTLAPPRRRP